MNVNVKSIFQIESTIGRVESNFFLCIQIMVLFVDKLPVFINDRTTLSPSLGKFQQRDGIR